MSAPAVLEPPTCHWDDCGMPVTAGGTSATGSDLQALFQHIMADHVRSPDPSTSVQLPPIQPAGAVQPTPPPSLPVGPAFSRAFSPTICEWDHCHQPLESSGLFDHLMTEHLHPADLHYHGPLSRPGLPAFPPPPPPPPLPVAQPPLTPQSPPSPTGLVCQWEECTHEGPFETTETLKEHVIADHIGSGQSSYRCHWRGCPRAEPDAKPFPQRQKIVRHLLAHLGAKTHICPEPGCGKTFAEPSALEQHMRVHTDDHEPRRRRSQVGARHAHGHGHSRSHSASGSRSIRGVDASRASSISVTETTAPAPMDVSF